MIWMKFFLVTALLAVFYCAGIKYIYRDSSFKEVRRWSLFRVIILPLLLLSES